MERRGIDGIGPIAFRDGKAGRAPAVLDVGVEGNRGLYRLVISPDMVKGVAGVDAVELFQQPLQRVGYGPGHLFDAVFVP